MRLLHGTTSEAAAAILEGGFRLDAERRSDPGDFGWGVYLTGWGPVARASGRAVVVAEVELERPKTFGSKAAAYEWLRRLHDGALPTVQGSERDRVAASKQLRRRMLERGVDGIVIRDAKMDPEGRPVEVVVYRLDRIRTVLETRERAG